MHLTVHDGYGRVALQILSLGRQAKCRCYWNWKVEPTIQMKDEDDKKFSIVVLIVDFFIASSQWPQVKAKRRASTLRRSSPDSYINININSSRKRGKRRKWRWATVQIVWNQYIFLEMLEFPLLFLWSSGVKAGGFNRTKRCDFWQPLSFVCVESGKSRYVGYVGTSTT